MNLTDHVIYLDKDWTHLKHWLSLKTYSSYFILCDENTYINCLPILKAKKLFNEAEVIYIHAGEEYKTIDSVEQICSKMIDEGIDRSSLCIALGGGMICDLMGFCASITLRGVDCIYIPTSLLAMADACIGGKTGINFHGWKNQLGTFSEPKLVAIDPIFLNSLDDRNTRNGFVEMIKHSLLIGSKEFDSIQQIDLKKNNIQLLHKIKESVDFKIKIVTQDFKEKTIRKTLNLGHTLGHAIESFMLEKGLDVLHGEAVAMGLIYELQIAGIIYHNNKNYFGKIIEYLNLFKLDYIFDANEIKEIIKNLTGDKKKLNHKILFSLLYELGDCRINVEVSEEIIDSVFK